MPGPRQTDFSAGEISPLLQAKVQEAFYAHGLKGCRDFFITKFGAAMSRPGTTYVGEVTNSPVGSGFVDLSSPAAVADHTVLIPFAAADDESFCLVVQPGQIQFVTKGGYVELGPGIRYTVVTPYAEADLRQLHYAQVGEVLTLVCPNFDAYELRHLSDAPPSWSFLRAVSQPPTLTENPATVGAGGTVGFGDVETVPFDPTSGFMLVDGPGSPGDDALPTPDEDHPAREWIWQVTAIVRDNATGELRETMPFTVSEKWNGSDPIAGSVFPLTSDKWALYIDMHIVLRRAHSPALLPDAGDATITSYNIYRGRGGLFGFVGSTTSREFVDVGDEPNYQVQPPAGTDPFGDNLEATAATAPLLLAQEVALGEVVRHYDRASAVAYFEQRRVFAGLTRREQDLVASATADFDNFDQRKLFHISGESVVYSIASRKRGRIRHLVTMDRLVVLTAGSSYHAGGQPGVGGLDYDSVWISLIEEIGANNVTPVVVDGTCFFARAKGRGLRGLVSADGHGGFTGFDASALAEHLFRTANGELVDLTYAEDPWGIIWAVRKDGMLLSLTYDRQRQMLAWARHQTDGIVEAVCAVPEGDEDAVYIVVARTIGGVVHRYVERMTSRHERGGAVLTDAGVISTPPDYICVDSAESFVGDVGTDYTVITGLDHLEGKDVWLLGENRTPTQHTVQGGQIDLGYTLEPNITDAKASPAGPRVLVYVGLAFTPRLELLPVAGGDRGQMKQVHHVTFEVVNSRGLRVTQEGTDLDEMPDRDVSDGFQAQLARTEVVRVPVRGTWDFSAGMVLEQQYPLPVTVLGLSREVAVGEAG